MKISLRAVFPSGKSTNQRQKTEKTKEPLFSYCTLEANKNLTSSTPEIRVSEKGC